MFLEAGLAPRGIRTNSGKKIDGIYRIEREIEEKIDREGECERELSPGLDSLNQRARGFLLSEGFIDEAPHTPTRERRVKKKKWKYCLVEIGEGAKGRKKEAREGPRGGGGEER